jgi:isochorismate hydrolase
MIGGGDMDRNFGEPGTNKLLSAEECALVFIDFQEKLLSAMARKDEILENAVRLLKFSKIVGLPVVYTEQIKLGSTAPQIRDMLERDPIEKNSFSCFLSDEFSQRIREMNRRTLILTGIEAHICVAQTALQAVPSYEVHVVSDAISSRSLDNWRVGIDRMRSGGATITSTEMLIFEILKRAGTDEFRAALALVK